MSLKQRLNYKIVRHLLLRLRQYGLNPRHWRIAREVSTIGLIVLRNRRDPSFQLAGRTGDQEQAIAWLTLTVISV